MLKAKRLTILIALIAICFVMVPARADAAAKTPGKVKITTVSVSGNTITVNWKKAANAKTYRVYSVTKSKVWKYWKTVTKKAANKYADTAKYKLKRSGSKFKVYRKSAKKKYKLLKKTSKRSVKVALAYGTAYTIAVRAYNGKKAGKYSSEWKVKTEAAPGQGSSDGSSAYKAKYSYDLKFFNEPYGNGIDVLMYLRTDNPSPNFIMEIADTSGNKVSRSIESLNGFDDLDQPSESSGGWKKVEGGFVGCFSVEGAGSLTFTISEPVYDESGQRVWDGTIGKYAKAIGLEKRVYFKDYSAEKTAWMQSVIDEATNSGMTKPEKMQAISQYMGSHSIYVKTIEGQSGYVYLAADEGVPVWKTEPYRFDSYTSPAILVEFGRMIGYPMVSLYGKYPVGSEEWIMYHYIAESTEDGSRYAFCPGKETGYIDAASIKPIDFKTYEFY